jgi:pSer/pThr/pTyr-binding forkhead associated (FHA) protein
METFFRIVGLVAVVLSCAMVAVMLLTFRKEQPVGRFSPLLSALLSLVTLPLFLLFSGARLNDLCAMPILICGSLVGWVQARTTRLYRSNGRVMARRSLWFLVAWFASLLLAQFLSVVGSVLLASVALIPLFFSTGTQLGLNGSIFVRRRRFRDGAVSKDRTRVAPPAQAVPPASGSHGLPGTARAGSPRVRTAPDPGGDWYPMADSGPAMPSSAGWGRLSVIQGLAEPAAVRLDKPVLTIGRSVANDLVLHDGLISRQHAQIRRHEGGAVLQDLDSTNGTFLNGKRISGPQALRPGDVVRLGHTELVFEPGVQRRRPPVQGARVSLVLDRSLLTIGRSSSCDLVLVDSGVSRRHAEIRRRAEGSVLRDLGSRNGTYVNGQRVVGSCAIQPGDVIRIGSTELVVQAGGVRRR